ncbi:MAG TPA: SUMF1/EgtB/PvdO family nonheme iron enzyme [Candidatus Omnitrophota bacterium]|nr:SUMF1/EgtB/PvdO family nonheme iron enzyme [Candidatus Omnitrophota bacterium]HRZ15820.1 SUMF1/EgtB/PvdO family nonheme iron enzyme [Candidatus Omnitrophota bacterium]
MKKLVLLVAAMLLVPMLAFASHLKIDNGMVSEINTDRKAAKVQFNLSWDNSWKNETNCDGVWVFAKFLAPDRTWKHVSLTSASGKAFNGVDAAPALFSPGDNPDLGLWIPAEKTGAFIFKTKGSGSVFSRNAVLVWDFARDGLTADQVKKTAIKVFGFEMVYIPRSKFYVGDPKGPDGPDNTLYTYPNNGSYLIKSEEPILVDKVDGALFCDQDNPRSREDTPFTVPQTFPKGFDPFWVMKYELTSQQFCNFVNTLTRKQQQSMVESDISGDEIKNYYVKTNSEEEHLRNAIVVAKKGNGTAEPVKFYTYAPARAVNFMSWSNITAIGDWAGLRPITELEYEKAARGPGQPLVNELAWGVDMDSPLVGRAQTFDGADGSGVEKKVPQTGAVNACFGGGIAPFDVGKKTVPDNPGFEGPVSGELFENSQHAGIDPRVNAGASFYGVHNLSGNVWERCITIGHQLGRIYDGQHGDGVLAEDGFANVANWPGKDGAGAGNRGGVWSSPAPKYLRISLRFAANFPKSEDGKNSGCRLGF